MNIGSISGYVISGSRIFSTAATMAIQFLSPKQAMRTDMFYETFSAVSVKLQRNLSQKFRKITALFWPCCINALRASMQDKEHAV